MAKYRARFERAEHNYHLYGVILESEDLGTVWRKAYSYARHFMSENEGEVSTMFIYFERYVPSLSSLTDDSFWAHITMIDAWIHKDHLADLDRIAGFERNGNDVYDIWRREA